jgi:hypothetical protein
VNLAELGRRLLNKAQRSARALRPVDLDALARFVGTDKSSDHHDYARHYRQHLARRRREVTSVLEIGVGGTTSWTGYETSDGGHSLRMWRRYFPNAHILGVDIHHKAVAGRRIAFEQGDQADPEFLRRIMAEYGPFDLIIDDGSHIGRHIIVTHAVMWDAVKPGGFYVIEDLQASYHPDWEGGPPGTAGTGAALVKELVDNTLERHGDSYEPPIASLHLYGGIVFLERR